ncbi:DUF2955 domain-containing protein [Ferrimonas aestuarii]|uniref:DUF2955 domain-containing protein n=1 Tax=Ferrimonas aestuarii TaxID=2569539 RepID=A0A4U1BPB1_9GAMM|nr:DUF2955 domain-containing protein [Ferrimonas aestuarii]TKB56245.1 DUF2955 domain-containing protein [Ferrimonas aestuarii]
MALFGLTQVQWTSIARITLIVTLTMLSQHLLQFTTSVYLALFPVVAVTRAPSLSTEGLMKAFLPVLAFAVGARFTHELFSAHPFVIWCISLWVFDLVRRRANSPAKVGQMVMPVLTWILIIVFSQQSPIDMTGWVRDMVASILVTLLVVRLVCWFLPAPDVSRPQPPTVDVTFGQRMFFVASLGIGLAFLMMVNLLSAAFCMVPVIIAVSQAQRPAYQGVLINTFKAHVGGCSIALMFQFLLMGHQGSMMVFGVMLLMLVGVVAYSMICSDLADQATHYSGLLGIMLPIQLYMTSTDLGVQDTAMRAWYMTVVLGLLFVWQGVIYGRQKHSVDHRGGRIGC